MAKLTLHNTDDIHTRHRTQVTIERLIFAQYYRKANDCRPQKTEDIRRDTENSNWGSLSLSN